MRWEVVPYSLEPTVILFSSDELVETVDSGLGRPVVHSAASQLLRMHGMGARMGFHGPWDLVHFGTASLV